MELTFGIIENKNLNEEFDPVVVYLGGAVVRVAGNNSRDILLSDHSYGKNDDTRLEPRIRRDKTGVEIASWFSTCSFSSIFAKTRLDSPGRLWAQLK
jgi:hypothetical protein